MIKLLIKHPTQGLILFTPIGLLCMIIVNIVFGRFEIIPKINKNNVPQEETNTETNTEETKK